MAELKGSETAANLVEAFLAESQASRRYLYFAQQADVDGRPEVAALFRTVAETETGHAFGHIDFLVDVGDPATGLPIGETEDNLASAVVSEREEGREMYPRFAETARREGFTEVADWMETLARAERDNADRFARALDDLD